MIVDSLRDAHLTLLTIFLDDGGVMNDNDVHGPQWQRLVGEYFSPILGGAPEAWAAENCIYMESMFDPAQWESRLQAFTDYNSWDTAYHLDWINGMRIIVGVPAPPGGAANELALQASAQSALPGAIFVSQSFDSGGAIFVTGTATIDNLLIAENTSTGGGLCAIGTVNINNSQFISNTSANQGGGVRVSELIFRDLQSRLG